MGWLKTAAAAVCLALLILAVRSAVHVAGLVPAMSDMENLPVIIIDAGHGGMDGGAQGPGGIVEKDINLAISLTLRDMFAVSGFEVVMTRETDTSIHDEDVTGVRRQKTSDMRNRLEIVSSHPGAVFVSIHQNKFQGKSSRGAQMFYSPNNPESERLAQILQERFASSLQPGNTRQIKKAGKDLFLMYNAECPAVLIECGFLSNPEEARMLTEPEYQNKVAFTVFASVMAFLDAGADAV
ncbi:MAG: N-acetylmuramoyl-L-alanine amidase [Oscillospiraceae bacterium]|nr:N-acetylmuramoyl-L-alanine amidase [Oscillospiraceae bacterium]